MGDIIFALASAPGRSGVAVVRVSGAGCWAALAPMLSVPAPRYAMLRSLRDLDGSKIDEALILAFEAGKSFTGEESVELHLHGSSAVVAKVLSTLGQFEFCRPAEAGEFTRRAFENGKLDLTQVEGLADLIDADTEAQRKQALDVYSGQLSKELEEIRFSLLRAVSLIEATIDFADEEVPEDVWPEVQSLLERAKQGVVRQLSGLSAAQKVRDGFRVAIVGEPNVGKSTLLNAISGRDVAIVTDQVGTTRDPIEVPIDLNGLQVTFVDTAGLRETDDIVEQEGVRRARVLAKDADVRIFLAVSEFNEKPIGYVDGDFCVVTKYDLSGIPGAISAKFGQGVEGLLQDVFGVLASRVPGAGLATRERHSVCLSRSSMLLDSVSEMLDDDLAEELIVDQLRSALNAIEGIIGVVGVEDVLGEIFSSFCIGK